MQREKVRVYALARELNVESKDLLDLCKQQGFDVKNQLSSLEPEQRDTIEQLVKRGGHKPSSAAPAKPAPPASLPDVNKAIPVLPTRRREEAPRTPPSRPVEAPKPVEEPVAPAAEIKPVPAPVPAPAAAEVRPVEAPKPAAAAEVPAAPAAAVAPRGPERPPAPAEPKAPEIKPAAALGPVPSLGSGGSGRGPRDMGRRTREARPIIAAPPPLKQRSLKDVVRKPTEPPVQTPIAKFTPEQLTQAKPIRPEDLLKPKPTTEPAFVDEEEGDDKNKKLKGVPGRDRRQKARNERAEQRKRRTEAEFKVAAGKVIDEEDRPLHQGGRKSAVAKLKARQQPTLPRKGKVPVQAPITVRSLSEALGIRSVDLIFKLRDHGAAPATNINSAIDESMAEVLALEYGAELEIKKPQNLEDQILAQPDRPEDLQPRAPVVTIMGHVDHGKTSLLDKIRASDIAATEAGGITQVIRAWRVDHGGRPITFLDTPGHEAFTKMRARGANVTDIAVIVVAADDGIMPQTEEAIQHARAANVPLVVAINKVDLPSANLNRTRQQLYSLNILPDNMGGDTPFVETSAATGKGIDELLDQISVVAELRELKANPNKAARGTCLEAMLSEGEGVRATLIVRDGTLRRGDVILCGATFGRVRQMYDDLGRPIQEAGPSVPVRITGLDEVPNADDPFVVVPDLAMAREVAEKRKIRRQETTFVKRSPFTLEKLTETKVSELKVILKADFRGSIEAIRKELEKLHHEEVRIKVLKDGIGGITEADVWLALTSPEDTIIVGFNVVPDDQARSLAEERGVQIRLYDIIYNLTNELKAALEGRLKPREEVVHLGRAVVRQTFKISRVGTIAGCYVTQGVIERSAKVRLIRDGVVIYPPAERTVGLESLKRHKDDVREVREGYDCGIKIAGYDDVKVGDVIEAFRVEQVQRTL